MMVGSLLCTIKSPGLSNSLLCNFTWFSFSILASLSNKVEVCLALEIKYVLQYLSLILSQYKIALLLRNFTITGEGKESRN